MKNVIKNKNFWIQRTIGDKKKKMLGQNCSSQKYIPGEKKLLYKQTVLLV